MRQLLPAFDGLDVAFVSVSPIYAEETNGHRFYAVKDAHRLNRLSFLRLTLQLLLIVVRERPDVVVTTGSAPGLVCIALCKTLVRSRTMWIDSIANCETLSSSGRHARRFADVWLTQWPQLQEEDGPDYWGSVL